jgi:hypothetical protein
VDGVDRTLWRALSEEVAVAALIILAFLLPDTWLWCQWSRLP